jgi:hypothetical protein
MIGRVKFYCLSMVILLVATAGMPARGLPAPKPALKGTIQGSYHTLPTVDGPITSALQGTGLVTPLGRVSASGYVWSSGYAATSGIKAGGSVTLSNSKGSVTVSLTGPGPSPTQLNQYTVTNATGAFAGLAGKTGTATVKMTATGFMVGTFSISFS